MTRVNGIVECGPFWGDCRRSGGRSAVRHLLLSTVLLVVSCDSSAGPQVEDVVLNTQGRVVDFDTGSPIPSALVQLGVGGHFSFPQTVDTTTADAQGNYTISKQVRFQRGNCGYWIGGSAVGYEPSDPAFTVEFLKCVPNVQSLNVRLKKKP